MSLLLIRERDRYGWRSIGQFGELWGSLYQTVGVFRPGVMTMIVSLQRKAHGIKCNFTNEFGKTQSKSLFKPSAIMT